jgi:hypothetical protein
MNVLLDVVIGLAFVYFLAAMLCSSVMEVIARKFAVRGKMMHEGLARLVSDRWIYLRLINHTMVSGLFRLRPGEGNPPSYLPAHNFSIALVDTLLSRLESGGKKPQKKSLDRLKQAVDQARTEGLGIGLALQSIVEEAADMDAVHQRIEAWYNSGMERVNGWYKAYTQKRLFVIGLAVALVFNIDTLQIVGQLSQSAALRAAVVESAEKGTQQGADSDTADAGLDLGAQLEALYKAGLPIGYSCLGTFRDLENQGQSSKFGACLAELKGVWNENLILKLLGWLLTAVGISFGAPFWFDATKKLVNVRNAGLSPVERKKSSS